LAGLAGRAASYAAQASGPGTQRAYASAWRAYSAWCVSAGRAPLNGDPGLLALYLTQRADDGLSVASLGVARAAIRAAHRLGGIPLDMGDARLGLVMEGITRSKGIRPRRQAAAAVPDILRRLLAALPDPATPAAAASALGARHRAMLLLGFGAALRRSEIVALTLGDVTVVDGRGLSVLVRRSKTDQQGRGRTVAICANHKEVDFCAVTAFERWMAFRRPAARADSGAVIEPDGHSELPLFCGITGSGRLTGAPMSDKIVARLVKQACELAGLDPRQFSGHSLRRGLLTAAGDLQLPLVDLMRQSRHASVTTALSYIEAGDVWRNNITAGVFGQTAQTKP
jgi:integrase